MLTGKELGAAIESARKLKRITKKALADHFNVKPPTVQDWVNRGTIDKARLPGLWAYFADVVPPEHWGLARLGERLRPTTGCAAWREHARRPLRRPDAPDQ
jgi:transcriptional regulator with XRE-family HTH domain